ncbi:hypothetical protein EGQ50_00955 [Coxiella endosymbiont of Amblyomma sculptum]|nr:hypothetical protein EGQ50_00955 [Coxiella endosymbiont of Amblyomma sculptum]
MISNFLHFLITAKRETEIHKLQIKTEQIHDVQTTQRHQTKNLLIEFYRTRKEYCSLLRPKIPTIAINCNCHTLFVPLFFTNSLQKNKF